MKLTKEETDGFKNEGQLITDTSLRPKKESVDVKCEKVTTERQPEMTEDDSVVSAYQEGGGKDGERKDFEVKMLLRRQEAEKKMMKIKNSEDATIDSLVEGVRDCSISNKKDRKEEDELSGKLSHLSLKQTNSLRQEPREDDERGDEFPPPEEEDKGKRKEVHDQKWAVLDEPAPRQEAAEEEPEESKKAIPRKPIGGVAVYPNKNAVNNAYHHPQQMILNDPSSLQWNHYQQQQQQQALTMPQNFPNYQQHYAHQQQNQQYVAMAATNSKRGFDYGVQDIYPEAPKYVRPQQMPQNNLDSPGTPLSPTSFNKSVSSTVCTKQMAGATLLQQNTEPAPMLSPTHQQPQNWNSGEYPLKHHHQPQQQQYHHHHQQQHQHNNLQQGIFSDYPSSNTNIGDLDLFLDEVVGGVGSSVDDTDFDGLLSLEKAIAANKEQDESTIQKDLEPILSSLSSGLQNQQQQTYIPESSPPPSVFNCNNKGLNAGSIMTQNNRTSQEDGGYATDQSPSHESQFAPSPQSVMEASPGTVSSVGGTSPPIHHNSWSPQSPSNMSEASQDSGVCSPMSEDGKSSTYGQIKSPRSVSKPVAENNFIPDVASPPRQQQTPDANLATQQEVCVNNGYIVPPGPADSMLRLSDISDFNFSDENQRHQYVDEHLEELEDAVSVCRADVHTMYDKKMQQKQRFQSPQIPPQQQQQQQFLQNQQQQQQQQFLQNQQQQQQHQQQATTVTNTNAPRMDYVSQVQQTTTNIASGSGGVMLKNASSTPPMVPLAAPISVSPRSMIATRQMVAAAATSASAPAPTLSVGNNRSRQTNNTTTNNTANINISAGSPTETPIPNAEGKLPIPATPRRQNVNNGATPMLGLPNNGQIATLLVFNNPPKPRFPNIAPKSTTPDGTNGATSINNSNSSINTNNITAATVALTASIPTTITYNNNSSGNNNINSVSATPCSNASPSSVQVQQQQAFVANGNSSSSNNHSSPPTQQNGMPQQPQPQQNGVAVAGPHPQQQNVNKTTKTLNFARRSVATLVREDLEYTDTEGDTNLHVAVCRTDRTDPYLIQALLERLQRENLTSMIDAQNNAGQTALYLAVSSNDPRKVKVLVDKGADVTLYAETRGYDGKKEKMAAIHCASSRGQGYLSTLNALLTASGIQVDQVNSQGHTALHCAILSHRTIKGDNQPINSLPIIEALVMAGANPNLQVQNGRTALMFALESRHLDVFEKIFSMVKPENREACLKTHDAKGNSVLKIAERLKATLSPTDHQRLQNCLRRSIYQRSAGMFNTASASNGVSNGARIS